MIVNDSISDAECSSLYEQLLSSSLLRCRSQGTFSFGVVRFVITQTGLYACMCAVVMTHGNAYNFVVTHFFFLIPVCTMTDVDASDASLTQLVAVRSRLYYDGCRRVWCKHNAASLFPVRSCSYYVLFVHSIHSIFLFWVFLLLISSSTWVYDSYASWMKYDYVQ